jgi:predicted ATPase
MIEKQLGRLRPNEHRLLEVASVVGAEFSTAVVAATLEESAERVEEWCEALARRDQFLRARGTEVLADGSVTGRYGFLHALYQQALYERVASARRARLHRRIGEWEEQAYATRIVDIAPALALHFERGHDPQRALQHLTHAGEHALRRSAHPEAISLLGKGLALLMTLPDTPERAAHELLLQTMIGAALAVTKGYASPEVEHAHMRAFQLCQRMDESPPVFPVLAGIWAFRCLRAEVQTAEEVAAQLFRVAQSAQDPALLLWAHTLLGLTLSMRGEPVALRHLEDGIALYDPHLHGPDRTQVGAQDPKVTCLSYSAWGLWRLGYPDQARQRIAEALAWAEMLSHPFSSAFALGFAAAGVGMFLRDAPGIHAHTALLMKMSHEQGFPYWLGWGGVWQGGALALQGEPEAAIAAMRAGMAILHRTGAKLGESYILAQLAEAHGALGQASEGLDLLAQALALAETTGERWYEAELHRLKGELLLQTERHRHARDQPRAKKARRGAAAGAPLAGRDSVVDLLANVEACFLTAIAIARQQHAKSLELRAATSLSRLWQRQGKRQPAHELLSQVYGWFTEGFDTADLRDASTLLTQLA